MALIPLDMSSQITKSPRDCSAGLFNKGQSVCSNANGLFKGKDFVERLSASQTSFLLLASYWFSDKSGCFLIITKEKCSINRSKLSKLLTAACSITYSCVSWYLSECLFPAILISVCDLISISFLGEFHLASLKSAFNPYWNISLRMKWVTCIHWFQCLPCLISTTSSVWTENIKLNKIMNLKPVAKKCNCILILFELLWALKNPSEIFGWKGNGVNYCPILQISLVVLMLSIALLPSSWGLEMPVTRNVYLNAFRTTEHQ